MNLEFSKRKLVDIVKEFDNLDTAFSESQICDKLRIDGVEPISEGEIAESAAFSFKENYQNEDYGWGTYYGPKWIGNNGDGTATVSPSLKKITAQMISYWEKRVDEAKNPLIRSRYADLVWDFCKEITGQKPAYKFALIVIDSNLAIAKQKLHKYSNVIFTKLERALELSIRLKNKSKIEEVKKMIFDLEEDTKGENSVYVHTYSYDILMHQKNFINNEEEQTIINRLEERLEEVLSREPEIVSNPFLVENPAIRLADYYKASGNISDLKRVLLDIEKANTGFGKLSGSNLIFGLEKMQELYNQFSLKDEEKRILKLIQERSPEMLQEMKKVMIPVEVNLEEEDKFINSLIDGSLDSDIAKIVSSHTPSRDNLEEELKDLYEYNFLKFIGRESYIEEGTGRKTAEIPSGLDDVEGKMVTLLTRNLSFEARTLKKSLWALIEKHELTAESLVDLLYESSIFEENRKEMIQKGISAYFDRDYITCIHVLIPQIENLFWTFLMRIGQVVTKPGYKSNGYDRISLGSLLQYQEVKDTFGEDISFYLQTVLTDPRGLNLRNDTAHGIPSSDYFSESKADRVLHILLCLGLLREKPLDKS